RVNQIGVALGLGLQSDVGETTFGIEATGGFGKTVAPDYFAQVGQVSYRQVDARVLNVSFFVAGAIEVGEFATLMRVARDPASAIAIKAALQGLRARADAARAAWKRPPEDSSRL